MSRPIKCRRVASIPDVTFFKPAGIPLRSLEEIQLTVEEVEALRLKDLEGLDQEHGAEKMNVSRPTFQRILVSARQKVTDALFNGKAVRIEGGNFEVTSSHFRCRRGHEWDLESTSGRTPEFCPTCNTTDIQVTPPVLSGYGRRGNKYRGRLVA